MRRMKRLIFCILWYCIVAYLPASYMPGGRLWRKLRLFVCRRLFKSCGTNVNVETKVKFGSGRRITIGENSGIGVNASLSGTITIGKNVMMGPDVIMITQNHNFHRIDIPMTEQGEQDEKPIQIGDNVWLGARVIILPGVNVGDWAVVGAGSVVTNDVPSWAVVGGNPARIIRFSRSLPSEGSTPACQ